MYIQNESSSRIRWLLFGRGCVVCWVVMLLFHCRGGGGVPTVADGRDGEGAGPEDAGQSSA